MSEPVDDLPINIPALLTRIRRAHAEVEELAKGKRWQMCVPAQHTDSDMVIGDALRHAEAFIRATLEPR